MALSRLYLKTKEHGASKSASGNPIYAAKSLQLCPTLCDPIDGSPPGSPIPGILQATQPWSHIELLALYIHLSVSQTDQIQLI